MKLKWKESTKTFRASKEDFYKNAKNEAVHCTQNERRTSVLFKKSLEIH